MFPSIARKSDEQSEYRPTAHDNATVGMFVVGAL